MNRIMCTKNDRFVILDNKRPITVELGCGQRKQIVNSIGIDIEKYSGVDIVYDLNNGIPLNNDSVDIIVCRDFIEHIKDSIFIMKEIWRVLSKNGVVEIIVPSTDGRGAFQDANHKSYWNEGSFGYWVDDSQWADGYRGICLFYYVYNPRTVGLNPDGSITGNSSNPVKHVHVKLAPKKCDIWYQTFMDRNRYLLDKYHYNPSVVRIME